MNQTIKIIEKLIIRLESQEKIKKTKLYLLKKVIEFLKTDSQHLESRELSLVTIGNQKMLIRKYFLIPKKDLIIIDGVICIGIETKLGQQLNQRTKGESFILEMPSGKKEEVYIRDII